MLKLEKFRNKTKLFSKQYLPLSEQALIKKYLSGLIFPLLIIHNEKTSKNDFPKAFLKLNSLSL